MLEKVLNELTHPPSKKIKTNEDIKTLEIAKNYLKSFPFIGNCIKDIYQGDDLLESMIGHFEYCMFSEGDLIYKQKDFIEDNKYMYFILSGKVGIYQLKSQQLLKSEQRQNQELMRLRSQLSRFGKVSKGLGSQKLLLEQILRIEQEINTQTSTELALICGSNKYLSDYFFGNDKQTLSKYFKKEEICDSDTLGDTDLLSQKRSSTCFVLTKSLSTIRISISQIKQSFFFPIFQIHFISSKLKNQLFLEDWSLPQIQFLASKFQMIVYSGNIFTIGEEPKGIYLALQGEVELTSILSKEHTIVESGEIFGVEDLMSGGVKNTQSAIVASEQKSKVYFLDKERVIENIQLQEALFKSILKKQQIQQNQSIPLSVIRRYQTPTTANNFMNNHFPSKGGGGGNSVNAANPNCNFQNYFSKGKQGTFECLEENVYSKQLLAKQSHQFMNNIQESKFLSQIQNQRKKIYVLTQPFQQNQQPQDAASFLLGKLILQTESQITSSNNSILTSGFLQNDNTNSSCSFRNTVSSQDTKMKDNCSQEQSTYFNKRKSDIASILMRKACDFEGSTYFGGKNGSSQNISLSEIRKSPQRWSKSIHKQIEPLPNYMIQNGEINKIVKMPELAMKITSIAGLQKFQNFKPKSKQSSSNHSELGLVSGTQTQKFFGITGNKKQSRGGGGEFSENNFQLSESESKSETFFSNSKTMNVQGSNSSLIQNLRSQNLPIFNNFLSRNSLSKNIFSNSTTQINNSNAKGDEFLSQQNTRNSSRVLSKNKVTIASYVKNNQNNLYESIDKSDQSDDSLCEDHFNLGRHGESQEEDKFISQQQQHQQSQQQKELNIIKIRCTPEQQLEKQRLYASLHFYNEKLSLNNERALKNAHKKSIEKLSEKYCVSQTSESSNTSKGYLPKSPKNQIQQLIRLERKNELNIQRSGVSSQNSQRFPHEVKRYKFEVEKMNQNSKGGSGNDKYLDGQKIINLLTERVVQTGNKFQFRSTDQMKAQDSQIVLALKSKQGQASLYEELKNQLTLGVAKKDDKTITQKGNQKKFIFDNEKLNVVLKQKYEK